MLAKVHDRVQSLGRNFVPSLQWCMRWRKAQTKVNLMVMEREVLITRREELMPQRRKET